MEGKDSKTPGGAIHFVDTALQSSDIPRHVKYALSIPEARPDLSWSENDRADAAWKLFRNIMTGGVNKLMGQEMLDLQEMEHNIGAETTTTNTTKIPPQKEQKRKKKNTTTKMERSKGTEVNEEPAPVLTGIKENSA
jgi:hypothetical protein